MTALHVLDTDVCIDLLRGRKSLPQIEVIETAHGPLALTSITVHELVEGARRASDPLRAADQVARFLLAFDVLPYDQDTADIGGRLAGDLARIGKPIGDLDTMIAATVLHHGGTLVTRNRRHFSQVKGLTLETP